MPLFRDRDAQKPPAPVEGMPSTRKVERTDRGTPAAPTDIAPVATSATDPLDDPVVGWLAIVAGTGCGTVLPLGYGVNDIGHGNRIRLQLPTTTAHAAPIVHLAVIYTARTRCFYVQAMDSDVCVNGAPLQASIALQSGDTIRVGDWVLRFVSLCGADFDWKSITLL